MSSASLLKKLGFASLLTCAVLQGAANPAQCGHEGGNGGAVLDCFEPAHPDHRFVLLWDYYLGNKRGFFQYFKNTFKSADPVRNKNLILENIYGRLVDLKQLDPSRAALYIQRASTFFQEALIEPHVKIPDLGDAHPRVIPDNCKFTYAANQKAPYFPEDSRYEINQTLWDLMDLESQSGLVLHEIIYREALERGQSDSVNTVYFNEHLSSKKVMSSLNINSYAALLAKVEFWNFDYRYAHTAQGDVVSDALYGHAASSVLQAPDLAHAPLYSCRSHGRDPHGAEFSLRHAQSSARIEFGQLGAYKMARNQDLVANNNLDLPLQDDQELFELKRISGRRYIMALPDVREPNLPGFPFFSFKIYSPELGHYGELLRSPHASFEDYDCTLQK